MSCQAPWSDDVRPEPTMSFGNATETGCCGPYMFRVLRKGETPWALRKPPDTTDLKRVQLRALMLQAVARGNKKGQTSPFLHCTMTVKSALNIRCLHGRDHLYSRWLVRWPFSAISQAEIIDLSTKSEQVKWLKEDDRDTEYLSDCLAWVRGYCEKDKEVVCLASPPPHAVEWWDPDRSQWCGLQKTGTHVQGPPAATSQGSTAAKSQGPPAATSQDPSAAARVAATAARTQEKVPLQNACQDADTHQKQTTYTDLHTCIHTYIHILRFNMYLLGCFCGVAARGRLRRSRLNPRGRRPRPTRPSLAPCPRAPRRRSLRRKPVCQGLLPATPRLGMPRRPRGRLLWRRRKPRRRSGPSPPQPRGRRRRRLFRPRSS